MEWQAGGHAQVGQHGCVRWYGCMRWHGCEVVCVHEVAWVCEAAWVCVWRVTYRQSNVGGCMEGKGVSLLHNHAHDLCLLPTCSFQKP